MIENILDDNSELGKKEEISDRVLIEIKRSQKKYPKRVVEFVNLEIEERKINTHNFESTNLEIKESKISAMNWIKSNPKTSTLTLFAAILSGFVGSIIVLISVYSAIQLDGSIRKKIWRRANLLIILLIIVTMILSFTIN